MAKKAPKKAPAKQVEEPQDLISRLIFILKKIGKSRLYLIGCLLVLTITSTVWSFLGVKLQQSNADQLSIPYLFESSSTFHNAAFSGAHSFIIKWPLFFIVKLLGYSNSAFIGVTIAAVLGTVAILVWVLYRIDRRPLVLGTLCLALASVLLLVPAQPYAGGLLPVNMAMLATRNLEYAVYIAAVAFFVRSGGWRNWRFWLAVVLLGLLMASDKLFMSFSLLAALLALIVYSLKRSWDYVNISSSFLVAGSMSAVAGLALLAAINIIGLTHLSSSNSPYTFVNSGKDIALGGLYGLMGLATNFGANPAYDATIVRNIPHNLFNGLLSPGGPAYVLNFLILITGLYAAYRLLRSSWASKRKRLSLDRYSGVGLIMLWSAIAAFLIFIGSAHYYAVDARYLTISLFSLFICIALLSRNRNWADRKIYTAGVVIFIGVLLGTVSSVQMYHKQSSALSDMRQRNNQVAQALKGHPVDTLVGDYWRVLPIRQASANRLKVMPLSNCQSPRDVLSSKSWQSDLVHKRFAYLLSLDASLTDFPRCSISGVLKAYGRPNSSVLIAGSFNKPRELLLIYDHGAHPNTNTVGIKTPATILPVGLADLARTSCEVPTDMNIVAHQDDDLLFMNPDLLQGIKAGHCIRSVYITAGDSGFNKYYWLGREQGSEAAYSKMLGIKDAWIERLVKISDHEFLSIASPKNNDSVSLIFVHLPDGGLKGDGFANTNFESLAKLDAGQISSLRSVDGQSTYTSAELIAMLAKLMHVYLPSEIRTQANYIGTQFPDHSDHMAVGRFVKKAYAQYEKQQFDGQVTIPLKFYIGYPVHQMPQNISGDELKEKEAIFLEYARFDGGVCQTEEQCGRTPTYGSYLSREYQNAY